MGRKNKQRRRREFEARHIDQVHKDLRIPKSQLITDKVGPSGTLDRVEIDEDTPGGGKHYCVPCGRYFVSGSAMMKHVKSKLHKQRTKLLAHRVPPHSQAMADAAAGMGPVDNGQTLRPN